MKVRNPTPTSPFDGVVSNDAFGAQAVWKLHEIEVSEPIPR
jgi:hypothetical protein